MHPPTHGQSPEVAVSRLTGEIRFSFPPTRRRGDGQPRAGSLLRLVRSQSLRSCCSVTLSTQRLPRSPRGLHSTSPHVPSAGRSRDTSQGSSVTPALTCHGPEHGPIGALGFVGGQEMESHSGQASRQLSFYD